MSVQLVTYDLVKPDRDYPKLFEAIKALGTWWHCIESVWLISTGLSSVQVRDALRPYVDGNDKLAVFSLSGGCGTLGLNSECNDWLRTQLAA